MGMPVAAPRAPAEKKDRRSRIKPADAKPAQAEPMPPLETPPLEPPARPWQRLLPTHLPRRDWLLLGIGAVAGVSSCVVGELVVLMFRWLFGRTTSAKSDAGEANDGP